MDDRKCIVVRRRWLPGKLHPEDKNGAVMIGWVDLARGGIPLRIERRNVPAYYDEAMSMAVAPGLVPSSLTKPPFANYIVRAVEVKEIAPGFHYPVAGVEEEMGPLQVPTGGKPAAEFAPHVTREWKATKVDLNPVMTAENFKLQFPSQTAFVNEPTNDVRVTTDANGSVERLVQQARQEASSSVPYHSWLGRGAFPLCLLAIAAMFGSYMRRAR